MATQFYDQLGRVCLSKTLEDAATQSATNETDGIKVETRYKTDYNLSTGVGHTYQLTSNPFRAATATAATNEPTMGWTLSTALNTGRHSEVETFSGTGLPGPWGTNTATTGKVQTDIDANATTVTDQAGKLRRSITNALGQLTRVDEPNDAGQLGTVDAPNQPTFYTYDTLNNLTQVQQNGTGAAQCGGAPNCSQTRTFVYDSLSRLKSATNPESGLIQYTYDNNGNLTRKTDARGVQTDYVYDALNRVTNRNYSTPGGTPPNYQATPNVSYFYDNLANARGKLIKVSSAVSTTEYTSFDILGRVTASKQATDGVTYGNGSTDSPMTYTYNLGGALIEQQYPSGRKVQNTIDSNGDLEMVRSRKNANSGYWAYANNFTYNASGGVTSMQLGNGRWESTVFNSRLQPTQIALGTTLNATDKLKLDYSYGTTANNGNLLSQTITVPTVGQNPGFTAVQTYNYDSLNRLKSATENIDGNQTPSWKQTFTFDRYGNRRFDEANTTTIPQGCQTVVCNPTIDPATNKLIGYTFDSGGNTTIDAEGKQFTYDAENKQVKVLNAQQAIVGEYFYDGDGKRIKKYVPSTGELTIFVYDASSKSIAEYSTVVANSTDAKVAYLTADHLGSPRINTDANGIVISRHDYHPFGEEISTSQRTTRLNYAADTVRKQFTGYERDNEIDMDFAQARYFDSGFGRFSTPDPYNIILEVKVESDKEAAQGKLNAYLSKPQQWNRYAYVSNNPLTYIDPSGEELELTGTQEEKNKAFDRIAELCGEKCKGRLYQEVTKDGRTLIKYFSDKGGLTSAGNIGDVLQGIINSDTVVQLQVTSKTTVTFANGDTENISEKGASTQLTSSKLIQIFISDSVSMSKLSDSEWVLGIKATDGTKLVNNSSIVLAHELGHAWGGIKDKTFERYNAAYRIQVWQRSNLRSENDRRSLQVENWQRDRLGLTHRASH